MSVQSPLNAREWYRRATSAVILGIYRCSLLRSPAYLYIQHTETNRTRQGHDLISYRHGILGNVFGGLEI